MRALVFRFKTKEKENVELRNQTEQMLAQYTDTFRRWGYLQADIDPLNRLPHFSHRELDTIAKEDAEKWRKIYCDKIGLEFMHMPYPERCDWLANRMESKREQLDKRYVLERILSAEAFERFIHTRYVGAKRFSLDGLAVTIPVVDGILDQAANLGIETVMIGMAHRGRLNVMYHHAGVSAENIFAWFEDVDPKSALGSDDVKYHKPGVGVYKTFSGKEIIVDLSPNPSHLEAINPVVMGRARARQERIKDKSKVLAVLIHGDAAFAGQGITAEALNYAEIRGFRIGGTIHIITNNQIGFTAVPEVLHSTRFSSDAAKRLHVPIFHVNAEAPDAAMQVAKMATDYRTTFSSDVVIDLFGYRRYGHNEADDPTVTSPTLYKQIGNIPLLYQSYAKEIGVNESEVKELQKNIESALDVQLEKGRAMTKKPSHIAPPDYWNPYSGGLYQREFEVETKVSAETLEHVGKAMSSTPPNFTVHPKLIKLLEQRLQMSKGERPIDWGGAEALAFGTLLSEGVPVRITGQDVCRGTFSHRHAVLYDHSNGEAFLPLRKISPTQARFDVYDSILSEAAAVGFEYGFTRDYPEALVCWEAQFGDFVNGAQIIIDQFISAGEDKWGLLSGLVMLLPHGFEGQGPEHSHARLERFLQLCAEDNMQVCYPTSASQMFHMLRRQALRAWRKPLIVMTPKSMLRSPSAASSRDELINGYFQTVINDQPEYYGAERILLCSGKIVHELRAERKKQNDLSTAILSVEQLYPLPEQELIQALASFPHAKTMVWVQEEPANMGALLYIRPHLERLANDRKVTKVSRSASASPATGSPKAHAMEQEAIIRLAFAKYE
jgi:2-oxoglutarate dehydrogenase E1 component